MRRLLRLVPLACLGLAAWSLHCTAVGDPPWIPVPHPPLDGTHPEVRRRLSSARQEVDRLRANRSTGREALAGEIGRLGMLYHAYRLREAAEACYANATNLAPGEFRWPYLHGHVLRELGRPVDATAAFERAARLRPDDVPTLVHRAELEHESNRPAQVEALLSRALEIDRDIPRAWFVRGQSAAQLGDLERARTSFESAKRLDPKATAVNYSLGMVYRALGLQEEAFDLLARRGERVPRLTDPLVAEVMALDRGMLAHEKEASASMAEGDLDAAIDAYRRAVEAAPDEARTHGNLGNALARAGHLEAAAEELEVAVELDPGYAFGHYNLGAVLARSGDDHRAIPHYRQALAEDSGLQPARYNLANSLVRTGQLKDALRNYRIVVTADPAHVGARVGEATALSRLERYDEARTRLEEAHAALPEDLEVTQLLVRLLSAAPDDSVRDAARATALARALTHDRTRPDFAATLAMVAAENGAFDAAVRIQESLVRSAPPEAEPELRRNLELYRSGKPCRRP